MMRRVYLWCLRMALAPRWVFGLGVLGMAVLTQLIYWGFAWNADRQTEDTPVSMSLGALATQPLDTSLDLEPGHWQHGPSTPALEAYWLTLQRAAHEYGLQAQFSHQGALADWTVQGEYADWMAWLFELSKHHPWLEMVSADVQPVQNRAQEQLDMQLRVLAKSDDGEAVLRLAAAGGGLTQASWGLRDFEYRLAALEHQGDWVSPFGLARWHQALINTGWAGQLSEQRATSLTLEPLIDMQWLGTLRSASSAQAFIQVGGQVWSVQKGDRIGVGVNRVMDIQSDHLRVEVLTLKSSGELGLDVVVIGATHHE